MTDHTISHTLESLIKDILQITRSNLPSQNEKVTFIRPILGKYGFKKIKKYDEFYFQKIFKNNQEKYEKIPSYSNVEYEIKEYLKNNFKEIDSENYSKMAKNVALQFIISYLRKSNSFTFNSSVFKKLLQKLQREILPTLNYTRFFVPLHNLRGDFDEITLSNNLKIKKLTSKEFSKIADLKKTTSDVFGGLNDYPPRFLYNLRYMLEYKIINSEKITEIPSEVKSKIDDVISIMKLYKKGDLRAGSFYYQSVQNWENEPIKRIGDESPQLGQEKYLLYKKEIKNFLIFFKKLESIDLNENSRKFIRLALRRFSRAISEYDFQDKIIDFCISLETLYHKPDDRTELTYRISTNAAVLLGKNDQSRQFYFNLIKDCYNLRSSIVHTGHVDKKKVLGQERDESYIIQNLEDVTRQSILKFLSLCLQIEKTHKLILRDIDNSVLDTSARKMLQKQSKQLFI